MPVDHQSRSRMLNPFSPAAQSITLLMMSRYHAVLPVSQKHTLTGAAGKMLLSMHRVVFHLKST